MLNDTLQENKKESSGTIKKGLMGIIAGSALAVSTNAHAWFRVNANVDVNSNVVQATVSNNSSAYWQCRGRAFGQLQNYQWINNDFYFDVPPGQYRYGNVFSGTYNSFIAGDARVECRTR